jgi:hypothetical protein
MRRTERHAKLLQQSQRKLNRVSVSVVQRPIPVSKLIRRDYLCRHLQALSALSGNIALTAYAVNGIGKILSEDLGATVHCALL